MSINSQTANNLIKEIGAVIDYDINIMDEKGMIIASTDPTRRGSYHAGSHKIINEGLSELIVNYDNEFSGCKKGINLPIILSGEIIGTIGITGEVNEVIKYGNLIKKITEIMIQDLIALQHRTQEEQACMFFMNSLISGEKMPTKEVEEKLKAHGLDSKKPFVFVLLKNFQDEDELRQLVERFSIDRGTICAYNEDMGMVLLNYKSTEQTIEYIKSKFSRRRRHEDLRIAVSGSVTNTSNIRKAYLDALSVMELDLDKRAIVTYDDKIVEIALESINQPLKQAVANRVFSGCEPKEITEFAKFTMIYWKHNGSISTMSEELFLHKNTVQYKINKILKKTGMDLRINKDLLQLYLGSRWIRSD